MIQAGLIALIVAVIFGMGTVMGKKWEKSTWQPVYFDLAKQMTKLQTDLNLKNEVSKTETAKLGTELVIVSKESEIDYITMQAEVDRRVNDYLDKLALAGLQPLSDETGDTGSDSDTGIMPLATGVSRFANDAAGLNRSMVGIERDLAKRILKSRDEAITRNIICKDYLEAVEDEMKPLRDKYNAIVSP